LSGSGLTRRLLAQAANDEWEYYYPNKYDASDQKIIDAVQAKLKLINNYGKVNLDDVINGKLTNKNCPVVSWNPYENNFKVPFDQMLSMGKSFVSFDPLFSDREYGKKTQYGDAIAFPLMLTLELMPAMPKQEGIGDYMVVSGHNDTLNYYRPIHAGDTLFTIYKEQHSVDITPALGSHYRTFAVSGVGQVYNQRGELVAEGANILKESFRRHKDPAKRNPDKSQAWESPDWWHNRPAHQYTDQDWDKILSMWKKETYRGEEPLYWDEVKVGDQPSPIAVGPMLAEEETDMVFAIPDWCTDVKKTLVSSEGSSKLVKNKQGIWVPPEHAEKKPRSKPFTGAGVDASVTKTPELANRDWRGVLQNAVCSRYAAAMLYAWMGNQGWLQRIGWDIMYNLPGYSPSMIPYITKPMMPALFDRYPYMEKVPLMKDKRVSTHAMEGDMIVSKAYVTGKYEKNNEYFVDLIWWVETIDEVLIEEGFAVVKLPKNEKKG
jgi:acyl dehydratase